MYVVTYKKRNILNNMLICSVLFITIIFFFNIISKSASYKENNNVDESIKLPIIMYHSIYGNNINNKFIVAVNLFESDMKYLVDNGYNSITLDDLYLW